MAAPRREGLRVRLLEPSSSKSKSVRKSNAEKSKDYRERLKEDPVKAELYRLKYLERNRANRSKVLTPEEQQRRRELNKVRQQKYRDRQKALKTANTVTESSGNVVPVTTRRQQQEQYAAIEAQRARWRKHKQDERDKWSSQKKRRNRERARAWYHQNKAKHNHKDAPDVTQTQTPCSSSRPTSMECQPPRDVTSTAAVPTPAVIVPQNVACQLTTASDSIFCTDAPPKDKHGDEPNVKPISKEGDRKALYRVKKAIAKLKPHLFEQLLKSFGTSTLRGKSHSDNLKSPKSNVLSEIERLKPKRSKKSLAAKKLLFDAVTGEDSGKPVGTYNKQKRSQVSDLQEFLDEVSINLPGKKSVSKKTLTQKKILPKTVRQLHKEYTESSPSKKMSRSTFYRHIPKHILTSSKQKHISCLCEICVGVDLKLNVLNKYLNNMFQGRDSFSELSLCQDVQLSCLVRECGDCGISQVKDMIYNQLGEGLLNTNVVWEQWETVQRANCRSKGPERVERTTSLEELCDALLKDLHTFSLHLFVFRWQYTQYKLCKSVISSRKSLGMAVLDFAENFTCRPQDEVQSAYYGFTQITVHPSVTFYACPHCSDIVTEYLIFLSDDLLHDAAMAQTILNQTVEHMQHRVNALAQVVIFSDGCAAQYKSKLPFHYLSDMDSSVAIERAFFGSRHGKGPCDACGGVIKKAVERDILSRQASIRNAADMYRHCTSTYVIPQMEPTGTCCHTRRLFFLLEEHSVNRTVKSSELITVPGTRKMHSIRRVRKDVIQSRNLSCFCSSCLDQNEETCLNKQYVKPWETTKIKHAIPDNEAHEVEACNVLNEGFIEVPPTSSPCESQRETFFARLQEQFSACETYQALKETVAANSPSLNLYPLPQITPKCVFDVGAVDSGSLSFLPEGMDHVFPVSTEADGNCVPRSLSLLVFGDQDHHPEVRCRIVIELVKNENQYLSIDESELNFLCQLSDFYGVETERVFQLETLEVAKPSVYMGLWQIMASANVFQAPVFSVYPSVSEAAHCYKKLYNRTILPRDPVTTQALLILWTSTRNDTDLSSEHWAANHVVPLMPLTIVSEIIIQN